MALNRIALMTGLFMAAGQLQAASVPITDYRLHSDITALTASFNSLTLLIGNQTVDTGPISVTLDTNYARGASYNTIDFGDGSELVVAHLRMDAPLFTSMGWGAQKLQLTESRAPGSILVSPGSLVTGVVNEVTMTFNTALSGVGIFDPGQALTGWRYENWFGLGGSSDKVKVKPLPPPPPPQPQPPRPIDIFIDPQGTYERLGAVNDARLVSPTAQVYSLGTTQVSVTLASPVPEVSTWLMALVGLGVLALRRPRSA